MANLFLKADEHAPIHVRSLLQGKKSIRLSELHNFAVEYGIVDECYVLQRDDEDPDNDIRISMQEVHSVFEEGECPEDLDFF